MTRYFPLQRGFLIASGFGPRSGGFHAGADFGWPGGSAGLPVYAVAAGTVIYAGAAQGYGGPDPAGWLVIDHPTAAGGGTSEYGHIIREVGIGARVQAGQRIGRINADRNTNGGVDPHCHLSIMPYGYEPTAKLDPLEWLKGAAFPNEQPAPKPGGTPVAYDYGITDEVFGYNPNTIGIGNSDGRRSRTDYITVHTQEGGNGDAIGLARFCNGNNVSYNIEVDDERTVLNVPVTDSSWSAAEANGIAFHLCFAGSYAGWSGDKWLSRDTADGLNEDAMLTRGAKAVAAACLQFGIPAEFAGGGNGWPTKPKGIVGHRDFGRRGGGHTDPGNGFPMDEFIRRVRTFINPPEPTGGFMSALSDAEQRQLFDAICRPQPSLVDGSKAFDAPTYGRLADAATYRTEREVAALRAQVAELLALVKGGK